MATPATHYGLYYYADRSTFDMYMLQRGLTSHSFTQLFVKLPDGVTFIFNFSEPLRLGERRKLPKDALQVRVKTKVIE
jgi:hypothetical protein